MTMERKGAAVSGDAVASELEVVGTKGYALIIQELSMVIDKEGVAV